MQCPVCNGMMFDNRQKKLSQKAPDFRCKDKECKFSFNPDTGEYEVGEYQTAVWLKKEVEKVEEKLQEEAKPKTKPISPMPKSGDEYVEGKKENTDKMCRTQLVCEIVKVYGTMGGSLNLEEIKETFTTLWNIIAK